MTPSIQVKYEFGGDGNLPHTFISVTHPDGSVMEYGLVPRNDGLPIGIGKIDRTTSHNFDYASDPVELSDQQYSDLMKNLDDVINNDTAGYFVTGSLFENVANCSDWAMEILDESGIESPFLDIPAFGPLTPFYMNPWFQGISDQVGKWFRDTLNWIAPRDPLALDLDGDGIETLPTDGAVVFDHDGDGVKNGTGWIGADDGILVLDRNGNGTIDTGAELFGDNTIKSDGTKARDGFDALADLDSNADGVVDVNDAAFAQLRVWRDANSDGVSQASELHQLSAFTIASINTAHTVVNTNLGDGNVARAEGSFNYVSGGVGEVGAAASLDLAANNFYREFTDSIPIPEELSGLPDLAGSGAVRDLKEAA